MLDIDASRAPGENSVAKTTAVWWRDREEMVPSIELWKLLLVLKKCWDMRKRTAREVYRTVQVIKETQCANRNRE